MNNIEKKLDALIDALGFEVEEVVSTYINGVKYEGNEPLVSVTPMDSLITIIDYKVTKKKVDNLTGVNAIEYFNNAGPFLASQTKDNQRRYNEYMSNIINDLEVNNEQKD